MASTRGGLISVWPCASEGSESTLREADVLATLPMYDPGMRAKAFVERQAELIGDTDYVLGLKLFSRMHVIPACLRARCDVRTLFVHLPRHCLHPDRVSPVILGSYCSSRGQVELRQHLGLRERELRY